jgi:hypothetical protein
MNPHIPPLLVLAGVALLISALIPTAQWLSCTGHHGGVACSPLAGNARDTWSNVSTVLLGLAWQDRRGQR